MTGPATRTLPADPLSRRRLPLAVAISVLVLASLLSHGPAFDAEFIRFDDTSYVRDNPRVAGGLELEHVLWSLTGYDQSNWHPLTWISHMIDVELFGLEPRGHHAVNLALHALNAALLFLVLRRLTGHAVPSFAVAAVFAMHPANVESVAWIAQRKTLLSTAFALGAIAAYARWVRGGGGRSYAASFGLLVLSLASKPMFVTFPFALLLLDFWPLRRPAFERDGGREPSLRSLLRGWWRLLPEKIPYLVLCAAVSVITMDAQRDAMSSVDHYPVSQRLGNVALSYVSYLGTFFAPHDLAVFYPLYPERQTPAIVGGAIALLAAGTVAFVRLGLRHRHLLVGWFWFLGMLVPVIGLVQVGMQSMADRYVYVPFWGVGIAVAWSLHAWIAPRLETRAARAVFAAAAAIPLLVLAALTYRYAQHWHDAITLFESALENTDDNWLAHGLLAERYYAQSDFEKTIAHSLEAIRYNRNLGTVRSTYGLALHDTGHPDLALEQFALAAQQEPENPVGLMNLGWFHAKQGRYDVALDSLEAAESKISRRTPRYTRQMIYANWAGALAKTGRLDLAREKYERALEITPDSGELLRDAARIDLRMGEPARAIERLRGLLDREPGGADAAWLLASAASIGGEPDGDPFTRALSADARRGIVAIDLARTLARDDRRDDAIRLLERLLEIAPSAKGADAAFLASTVHDHLGDLALERGDPMAALPALERALAIWPDNYDATGRLAFLLATTPDPALRDPARAVALAERAVAQRREFASLGTLAAALAAAERTTDAVEAAREGLALANEAKDARGVAVLRSQLELYSRAAATSAPSPR